MGKIRIATLIDAWFPFVGGGQVHVQELTKALSPKCDFTIFHSDSASSASRAAWSISVIPKVIKENKKKKFDLIHAHAFISGFPAKILSKILHIPVVFTVHGSHTLDLWNYSKESVNDDIHVSWGKYLLEKWLLTQIKYDRLISVSSSFLSYKNLNTNMSVIPNGVDTTKFDRVHVRKKNNFTLIFVGRDDPVKGMKYLEKAMQMIKQSNRQVKLLRISDGRRKGKKLIEAYKSAHLFVLPSLAEGQPISLLEAWSAKLPVIVTDVGDNRRLVKNGVNGYLVPPADAAVLANTILKAMKNPNLAKLGLSGYNLVKKSYSWDNMANKTLKVYKEVLDGN